VQAGLVATLNRPDGNVTGVTSMNVQLGAKRLALLSELLPRAEHFAALGGQNAHGGEPGLIAQWE
jgi:putative ABC transport system substrate-binding protein